MKNKPCERKDVNLEQISDCKQCLGDLENSFELLSSILDLAGNNVRLKILYLLFQEEHLCVCDLSDILEMKISAISQHLRKLKDRNIINPNRNAQTIYYSINKKYEVLLVPFFKLIAGNKIMKLV